MIPMNPERDKITLLLRQQKHYISDGNIPALIRVNEKISKSLKEKNSFDTKSAETYKNMFKQNLKIFLRLFQRTEKLFKATRGTLGVLPRFKIYGSCVSYES